MISKLGGIEWSLKERLTLEDLKVHFPDNPVWADQTELEELSKRFRDGKYEYRKKLYEILDTWRLQGNAANLIEAAFEARMAEWRSGTLSVHPNWGWSYVKGIDNLGAAMLGNAIIWPVSTPEEYDANQRHVNDLWLTVQTWQCTQDYAWLGPRIDQLRGQIELSSRRS